MGLLQKAYETYEHHSAFVGEYSSGDRAFKEPFAPVGHITKSANIEITINKAGKFVSATSVDKNEVKIIIPATEESAGRTSTAIRPHPLCDQIGYISPQNEKKYVAYLAQLTEWAESECSHPMLKPILTYVKGGTILFDLADAGITSLKEKDVVRWVVIGLNEEEDIACWTNKELFHSFSDYYMAKKAKNEPFFCMVTGEKTARANQHIKGVSSEYSNAKLISSNDTENFTYLGRFTTADEALTVGYEASQKAHNALKWIAADQGVILGGRTFVCWNPKGKKLHRPTSPLRSNNTPVMTMMEYQRDLMLALRGYRNKLEPSDEAVIAVFDAASKTSGRLAVTYYREMFACDFFERLRDWDETCCWKHYKKGISAPSLETIVNCAYGYEKKTKNGKEESKFEVDDRIKKQQFQRLISCRIDGVAMPYDIVHALAQNTMRPLAYKKLRDDLQFTACAVIRKFYLDRYKEEYDMALEKEKKDISYQYGRLLAVLEKAESVTYRKEEDRNPNAIRMQMAFCQRPAQTAKIVIEQVKTGYYHRLRPGSRIFYDRLIGEIYEKISDFPESEWNMPLKETYIMGYYLQKNVLNTKNNDDINETEESENE